MIDINSKVSGTELAARLEVEPEVLETWVRYYNYPRPDRNGMWAHREIEAYCADYPIAPPELPPAQLSPAGLRRLADWLQMSKDMEIRERLRAEGRMTAVTDEKGVTRYYEVISLRSIQ